MGQPQTAEVRPTAEKQCSPYRIRVSLGQQLKNFLGPTANLATWTNKLQNMVGLNASSQPLRVGIWQHQLTKRHPSWMLELTFLLHKVNLSRLKVIILFITL